MKKQKSLLSSLTNLYKPYPQVLKNFELKKNQNPEEIIHAIQASLNKHDYNMMKDSRMILRKSGTENKIRLMVEASNSQIANQMIDKANEVFIEKCKKKNFQH